MARIIIDKEQCILCGQCVASCPFGAMEMKDDAVEISSACRLCKVCVKTCPVEAISLQKDEPVEAVDKDAWKGILVYAEYMEGKIHPVAFELLGKAKELASVINQPVYSVLIGPKGCKDQAEQLLRYGAEKVFVYEHEELESFRLDVYANVFESCIKKVAPTAVLVGATPLGRALAPACATRFKTGLTADCTMLEMRENTDLVQIRPAFGGNIMAQILTANSRPQFATVRYKVMNALEPSDPAGEVIECETAPELLVSGIEAVGKELIPKTNDIENEEVLVVAGRGVRKAEDLEMLRELADLLGGQLATTRPLVEKGWSDTTKQIGLSGRTVKPKLIITAGVSGSVQFAAGMDGSDCIVAINSDPEAPIFKIAHYCIVKDLYKFVPELIGKLKKA